MDQSDEGLYRKYHIQRADGRDQSPGDKHYGCEYFVLDVTHDPFALPALRSYARACMKTHPALARDLIQWVLAKELSSPGA